MSDKGLCDGVLSVQLPGLNSLLPRFIWALAEKHTCKNNYSIDVITKLIFGASRFHIYIMSSLEDSPMSDSEGSEMSYSDTSDFEDFELSTPEDFESSTPEDACLECFCGRLAKLRISNTIKNPSRLFYNCPKSLESQCGYFEWADELGQAKHTKEINKIRFQCTQLQERLEDIQQRRENDRIVWQRERSELMTRLFTVQAELDEIKEKIKMANESELMPPLDKLSSAVADDDGDDAKVIYAT
ncbi:hypothetical protein SADUNF_Sadunf09G0075600 [Salix dunnii]|uniref:GRF-type domain-containing protein n=1 Tax=Salix dunnii TaxID=1413687 RepID=A0A835MSC5_9ROSI|nr:hypothetical protein SADUNF_Sadunf09G0075600 [Salix dunnii]